MRRRVLLSTLFVVSLGSLLHFAWEWSGRSPVVAIFAATSESTWEHLKMAFWPALLLAFAQRRLYGRPPGWIAATALRTLLPPLLIVLIFYGYTALLGTNLLVLDLATFVVAVLLGEISGHMVMEGRVSPTLRVLGGAAVVAGVIAFATLTFAKPQGFLFDDPQASRPVSSRAATRALQLATANGSALRFARCPSMSLRSHGTTRACAPRPIDRLGPPA